MSRTTRRILVGAALTVVFAAIGADVADAVASGDDSEVSISGTTLDEASRAALAETGGGTVVDSEVEGEENGYEVEVNLDDGTQREVQLDQNFAVVSSSQNDEGDDGDAE
jgi:uncharacterized membrane protein YkoI